MNPSKKGWLSKFLDYRREHFEQELEFEKTKIGQDPEHSFYGIIQPTGLMYGYPVQVIRDLEKETWNDKDRVKVLLINSLFDIATLYAEREVETADTFYDSMMDTLLNINTFYEKVYPESSISSTNWLGKKREPLQLTEQIIEKRVNITVKDNANFWLDFFHRSQLFLDVYIFGQWSHTKPDEVLQEFFKAEKEELSYNAVKVMSAAAHSNSNIEAEERSLFNHFIDSTGMTSEKQRVAKEYFEHGLGIQDIPIEETDPWMIRKFFFELALLTVWSDKKVEDSELEFLTSFNESLGFSKEDLDKSMMAMEGFVLENWQHLESLQDKKDFDQVSREYIARLSQVAYKFKNRLQNEVSQDGDLVRLIKKGNAEELSPEEQKVIKNKLLTILRKVPALNIIALPERFLDYKNVLKVFPKEVIAEVSVK